MHRNLQKMSYIALILVIFSIELHAQDTPLSNEKYKFGEVEFSYPSGWSVEKIENMNGILVINPDVEKNWQTNLFFEYQIDNENRSIQSTLDTLAENFAQRKKNFNLIKKDKIKLSNGSYAALLEYSHSIPGVSLMEWEVIISLAGNNRLFIVASSEKSLWLRDKKNFEKIIKSISFN